MLCATSHRDAVERLGVTRPGAAEVMICPDGLGEHDHYLDGECVRAFAYDHTPVAMTLQEVWKMQTDAGIQTERV